MDENHRKFRSSFEILGDVGSVSFPSFNSSETHTQTEFADVTDGVLKAFPLAKFLEDPKIAPYFRSLSVRRRPCSELYNLLSNHVTDHRPASRPSNEAYGGQRTRETRHPELERAVWFARCRHCGIHRCDVPVDRLSFQNRSPARNQN